MAATMSKPNAKATVMGKGLMVQITYLKPNTKIYPLLEQN